MGERGRGEGFIRMYEMSVGENFICMGESFIWVNGGWVSVLCGQTGGGGVSGYWRLDRHLDLKTQLPQVLFRLRVSSGSRLWLGLKLGFGFPYAVGSGRTRLMC